MLEQVADTHESLLRDDAADVWGAVAESTRCSAGITVTQSLARLTAAGYPIVIRRWCHRCRATTVARRSVSNGSRA